MIRALPERTILRRRTIIWIVGLLLLVLGLWRDETRFVMWRAINICLGCIGIG